MGPLQEAGAAEILRNSSDQGRNDAQLATEPHEQGFQRQRRAEVELLEGPPGLADDLTGALGTRQALGGAVLGEHGEAVGVDDGALNAGSA